MPFECYGSSESMSLTHSQFYLAQNKLCLTLFRARAVLCINTGDQKCWAVSTETVASFQSNNQAFQWNHGRYNFVFWENLQKGTTCLLSQLSNSCPQRLNTPFIITTHYTQSSRHGLIFLFLSLLVGTWSWHSDYLYKISTIKQRRKRKKKKTLSCTD